jgi:hypothetical protein
VLTDPDPVAMLADRLDPPPSPYGDHPADWSRDVGQAHLTVAQDEILEALVPHRRVAVASAHDLGKSFDAATASGWWIDTHPKGEALVVTTAPSWPQVAGVLWHEIASLKRSVPTLPGRVTAMCEWKLNVGDGPDALIGLGRKPADYDPTAFQGFHRRFLLGVVDEACGVPKTIFDAMESLATNEYARILAVGNPDDPASYFAEICKPGSGWYVIWLDALRSPNFTAQEVARYPALRSYMIQEGVTPSIEETPERVRELLVSPSWVDDKLRRWGAESPMFQSKCRGRFPKVTIDTLIHPHWVELAKARELLEDHTDPRIGADIARYGTDHTIIGLRLGGWFRVMHDIPYGPITEAAGLIQTLGAGRINTPVANVDDVGVGGGVTDILREEGYPVQVMIANAACSPGEVMENGKPRFKDARSEWWWRLREWLAGVSQTGEDGRLDLDPDDDELLAQITNVKYRINRHGQIEVESKDKMRERGLASPDRGDGLVMSLAPNVQMHVPLRGAMETSDLLTMPL